MFRNAIVRYASDYVIYDTEAAVKLAGFPLSSYKTTTDDGYRLTLHRLGTQGKNDSKFLHRTPILLQHGMWSSSENWLVMGPKRSLGYVLSEAGFDVWMGNSRGTIHSREHVKYSVDEDAFWRFSWHEMGVFDLPATIDFILKETGRSQLYYVGHSQGTSAFFVMTSERPEYNRKVRAMVALAPVVFLNNIKNIFAKAASAVLEPIQQVCEKSGIHKLYPDEKLLGVVDRWWKSSPRIPKLLCHFMVSELSTYAADEVRNDLRKIILRHLATGTSTLCLAHYAQTIRRDFRRYDYGQERNRLVYGTPEPPVYDLKRVTTPVVSFYSTGDWLTNAADVERLMASLGGESVVERVSDPRFNHQDFIWADLVTTEAQTSVDLGNMTYALVGRGGRPKMRTAVTGAVMRECPGLMVNQYPRLTAQPGWMIRALIVIAARRHDVHIFKEFWTRRSPNVVFHTPHGLVAYNPFVDEVFNISHPSNLTRELKARWEDLQGYTINVDMYSHTIGYLKWRNIAVGSGLDASALDELMDFWNVSINFYRPQRKYEGDLNSDIADIHLVTGKTDLSMNARFMIHASDRRFLEYTSTIFSDAVVIVMRKPGKLRGWDVFLKILHWKVWLCILLTIIVMHRFLIMSSNRTNSDTFVITIRSFFAIPVRKPPVKTSERWVVALSLFASTVIINTYTARLYYIIQSGQTYSIPNTMEDLAREGIPIMSTRNDYREYFEIRESKEVRMMGSGIQVMSNISDQLLESNAFVMREKEMKLHVDTETLRRDVHFVKEKLLSFTMAYVVCRGSPFLEPLTDFTYRAFETGLHNWWYLKTVEAVDDHNRQLNVEKHRVPGHSAVLTVSEIEIALLVLFVGQSISLLVFFMELCMSHIAKKRVHYTKKILGKLAIFHPNVDLDKKRADLIS